MNVEFISTGSWTPVAISYPPDVGPVVSLIPMSIRTRPRKKKKKKKKRESTY